MIRLETYPKALVGWSRILIILFTIMLLDPAILLAEGRGSGLFQYMRDGRLWEALLNHDAAWFNSREAESIAKNVLAFQQPEGGWPKNLEYTEPLSASEVKSIKKKKKNLRPTIDNGATSSELFFMANMYTHTQDKRYKEAFNRGFDYLIEAQYENGGWPQYYPLRRGYYTHITYNDDAMVSVLMLLHGVIEKHPNLKFVDNKRREKARLAEQLGIDCILGTQLTRGDKKTVWCAQYDEYTLEPAAARKYELVSLSGKESAGILLYLMELENPSEAVKKAIIDGIEWFEKTQIEHIKIVKVADETSPTGINRIVVDDTEAEPMWARFYDIDSDIPFFSDRDGKRYYKLSEISSERRNEYGWYGTWPKTAIKNYREVWSPKWR